MDRVHSATLSLDSAEPPRAPAGGLTAGDDTIEWEIHAESQCELFSAGGLQLDRWNGSGRLTVIKSGPHRVVYRMETHGERYYLKHFRVPDWKSRLQTWLRGCAAMREAQAIARVDRLGIPTLETVAVGRRRAVSGVHESYLITREIPNTQSLHDLVLRAENEPDFLSVRARRRIASKLGEFVGRLHRGGLIHHDLHAGNILVQVSTGDAQLWMIDLHSVRRAAWPSESRFAKNLAMLDHFFRHRATATDRWRFFRAYWSARLDSAAETACRNSARFAHRVCEQQSRNAYRKGDRKWSRGNRRLIIVDSDEYHCRGVAELGRDQILRLCDRVMLGKADSVTVEWNGRSIRGIVRRLPTGAARRAWETGHALRRRCIDTPRPLLFVEPKSSEFTHSVIVIEPVTESVPMESVLQREDDQLPDEATWSLATQLRRLHEARYVHRSLPSTALSIQPHNQHRVWLEQCEAIQSARWFFRSQIANSLAELTIILPVRRAQRLRFLLRYLGRYRQSEWKIWWRQIGRAIQHLP